MPASLVLLAAVGHMSFAEPLSALVHADSSDATVFSEFGLDGAISAKLGAAFGIARAGERLGLVLWGDATIAAGDLDPEDFRVRVGARFDLFKLGPFHLRGTLLEVLRATKTPAFEAESFGTEIRVAPGVTHGRWTLDAEAGVEYAELTRIAPTRRYRDLVYGMAASRWYFDTAASLHVGAAASVRVGHFEIVARGGWLGTGDKDFLPPLYAQLGAGVRF